MRWLTRVFALLWTTAAAHAGCSLGSLPFQLQNGTVADANQVMANFNAILSGAQANCAEVGVNTSITALAGLSSPLTPVLGGSNVFIAGPVTGTANAIVAPIQMPGAGYTLTNGYQIVFTPTSTNTGPTQLNFAGTGLISIVKRVGGLYTAAFLGGELTANVPTIVTYDGVNNVYALSAPNNSIASGGTGTTTLPVGILFGNGTSPITAQSILSPNNGGTGVSGPTAGVVISLGGNTPMSTQNPLSVAVGGTGVASPAAGVVISQGANNPMITQGPLLIANGGTGSTSIPSGVVVSNGSALGNQAPLSTANGGTGASSLPASGVVLSNGSALLSQAPLLVGNGGIGTANPGTGVAIANGTSAFTATSSYGTTTTVLHGNAGGSPAFGVVNLNAGGDVSGTLPVANGGTGAAAITVPTAQVFTSGSTTYTPPANVSVVHIRMIGGGGGGAGSGGAGGTGGTSSFGAVTALGGVGGTSSTPGAGGTGGAGGTTLRVSGASGIAGSSIQNTQTTTWAGTAGGTSGTGLGRFGNGGSGGASSGTNTTVVQLAGGGQGEYVETWLSAAAASGQTVTVGGAGTAGASGGAAGIAGLVLVEEFYGLL